MYGLPMVENRTLSKAPTSLTVPSVERGLDPIRSWSTTIAGVSPSKVVDVGTRAGVHESLDEGRVGLVDETARLGCDRGEDQRALAGARHSGEHSEPALGNDDVDASQVVLMSSDDADDVALVSSGLCSSPSTSHRSNCAGCRHMPGYRPVPTNADNVHYVIPCEREEASPTSTLSSTTDHPLQHNRVA